MSEEPDELVRYDGKGHLMGSPGYTLWQVAWNRTKCPRCGAHKASWCETELRYSTIPEHRRPAMHASRLALAALFL